MYQTIQTHIYSLEEQKNMATISELKAQFEKMSLAQKKQFIQKLKAQVENSDNPEQKRFLSECIKKYKAEQAGQQDDGTEYLPMAPQQAPSSKTKSVATESGFPNSEFDGTLFPYLIHIILVGIASSFTLGLAVPWALCSLFRWTAEHTVINGKRLQFVGTGGELFKKWIIWWLLTIVTCGFFSFYVFITMERWKAKHTTFLN